MSRESYEPLPIVRHIRQQRPAQSRNRVLGSCLSMDNQYDLKTYPKIYLVRRCICTDTKGKHL